MTNALKTSIARLGNKLEEHKRDAIPLSLPVLALTPYRDQARTDITPDSLRELSESIKAIGVIAPIFVRPLGKDKYEILAGERRWRAAQLAGLTTVPVLSKQMGDDLADKIHLAENIHRENLSTLDLAQRVQRDLDAAGGDLATVAAKYNKGKSWVSKLSAIAQGGDTMTDLVTEGVTADRAVLATVSSLERKAPERAKALGEQLKAAPGKSNKREVAEQFMKEERGAAPKAKPGKAAPAAGAKQDSKRKAEAEGEPTWRAQDGIARDLGEALIVVELSPVSAFATEFAELSKKFGKACLVVSVRHPDEGCAIVQFGNTDGHRRVYRADELRLLSVF